MMDRNEYPNWASLFEMKCDGQSIKWLNGAEKGSNMFNHNNNKTLGRSDLTMDTRIFPRNFGILGQANGG